MSYILISSSLSFVYNNRIYHTRAEIGLVAETGESKAETNQKAITEGLKAETKGQRPKLVGWRWGEESGTGGLNQGPEAKKNNLGGDPSRPRSAYDISSILHHFMHNLLHQKNRPQTTQNVYLYPYADTTCGNEQGHAMRWPVFIYISKIIIKK